MSILQLATILRWLFDVHILVSLKFLHLLIFPILYIASR